MYQTIVRTSCLLMLLGWSVAACVPAGSRASSALEEEPPSEASEHESGQEAESTAAWRAGYPIKKRIAELYHLTWYGVFENKWFGITTWQNPLDAWVTQEILFEVKPDFIVETGTFLGGSAAMWAMILEHINPDGRIITIDIKDRSEKARQLPIVQERVEFLVGSSTDPDIVSRVQERVGDGKVLVILDSLHTKEHVLAELKAYGPMVDVGSYVIVQDSAVNGHPVAPDHGPGPYEAVMEFLKGTNSFEIDKSRERFMLTNNPNGFLKRVR